MEFQPIWKLLALVPPERGTQCAQCQRGFQKVGIKSELHVRIKIIKPDNCKQHPHPGRELDGATLTCVACGPMLPVFAGVCSSRTGFYYSWSSCLHSRKYESNKVSKKKTKHPVLIDVKLSPSNLETTKPYCTYETYPLTNEPLPASAGTLSVQTAFTPVSPIHLLQNMYLFKPCILDSLFPHFPCCLLLFRGMSTNTFHQIGVSDKSCNLSPRRPRRRHADVAQFLGYKSFADINLSRTRFLLSFGCWECRFCASRVPHFLYLSTSIYKVCKHERKQVCHQHDTTCFRLLGAWHWDWQKSVYLKPSNICSLLLGPQPLWARPPKASKMEIRHRGPLVSETWKRIHHFDRENCFPFLHEFPGQLEVFIHMYIADTLHVLAAPEFGPTGEGCPSSLSLVLPKNENHTPRSPSLWQTRFQHVQAIGCPPLLLCKKFPATVRCWSWGLHPKCGFRPWQLPDHPTNESLWGTAADLLPFHPPDTTYVTGDMWD